MGASKNITHRLVSNLIVSCCVLLNQRLEPSKGIRDAPGNRASIRARKLPCVAQQNEWIFSPRFPLHEEIERNKLHEHEYVRDYTHLDRRNDTTYILGFG